MVQQANQRRSERTFKIGDQVYLKLQPYRQTSVSIRGSPYMVLEKIGQVAYIIDLPPSVGIHHVFHISQLKKHVGNKAVHTHLPSAHPLQNL